MSIENYDHILTQIKHFEPALTHCKAFKIKKIKFALSLEQRNDLLQTTKNNNNKHYLIIKTQLETGMRIGEIAHLTIPQVKLRSGYIHLEGYLNDLTVDETWHPKTLAGNRIIPINPGLKQSLYRWIFTRTEGYVFLSQKKRHFNEKALINMINKYARKTPSIGMNIGSHSLRRTFASFLLQKGVALGRISKILGHKSIKITMNYLYDIVDIDGYEDIKEVIEEMNEK